MLRLEQLFWTDHRNARLAGIDEAGRGPLAGPVVAAAVSMPPRTAHTLYAGTLANLTDSKRLSATRRKHFFDILSEDPAIEIGVGIVEPEEIDAINILRATHAAMARATMALPEGAPAHALVDGLPVRGLPCPFTAIVKGDAQSLLIAAASIIAKVTRDAIMDALDTRYPVYGFSRHKGYPTPQHLKALHQHGACQTHRKTFGPVAARR